MSTWVRTNRRAPGADYDDPYAERRPGPWHIIHPDRGYSISWCGRDPLRVLAVERTDEEPPAEEKRCAECVKAKAEGKPRPVRRRR